MSLTVPYILSQILVIVYYLIYSYTFHLKDSNKIYTYALWQKNTKTYKLLGIIVNGLMIVYDVYIQSILGVILISIAFISSLSGYIKENNQSIVSM